jgi:hypothetical protein
MVFARRTVDAYDLGTPVPDRAIPVPFAALAQPLPEEPAPAAAWESAGVAGLGYTLLDTVWPRATVTWSAAAMNFPEDVADGIVFTHMLGVEGERVVAEAFARWAEVSGLSFVQVADSAAKAAAPDIRIGWASLPSPSPGYQIIGQTAWYSADGFFQPGVTIQLLDPAIAPIWSLPGGPYFYGAFDVTLLQLVLHEIGHAVGIGHADAPIDLMYPTASTSNPDLAPDDVAAVRAAYPVLAAATPAPPAFAIAHVEAGVFGEVTGRAYAGPLDYLEAELIYLGLDGVAIAAPIPNVFLHGGTGDDALMATGGRNVLDGGPGSNFLVGAGGDDTFFVDFRDTSATIWSTVAGFGIGDIATVWGVNEANAGITWAEGLGAAGYTGLTMQATAPGGAAAALTLSGYGLADLSNGRLSVQFGHEPVSGADYMAIFALA